MRHISSHYYLYHLNHTGMQDTDLWIFSLEHQKKLGEQGTWHEMNCSFTYSKLLSLSFIMILMKAAEVGCFLESSFSIL